MTALTDKNLYAYCDNNPVVRKDTGGEYWETAFDVTSLAVTVAETVADPTDPLNYIALAGDFIDVITPVAGVGEFIKATRTISKVNDASKDVKKVAGKITGYTKHGLEQAMGRNGVGVAPKAILDAVKNPVKVKPQIDNLGRTSTKYTGKNSVVVLNEIGKIITCWAKKSAFWRRK